MNITARNIAYDIIKLFVFTYSFTIYYIYAYVNVNANVNVNLNVNLTESNLLLAVIITNLLYSILPITEIVYKFKYNNKTISNKIWKLILPNYRLPLSLLHLTSVVNIVLGIWICSIFLPINSSNCAGFEHHSDACISMQIISIMSLMYFAMLFIFMVLLSILCIIKSQYSINNETNNGSSVVSQISNLNLNPLQNSIPNFNSSDTDCGICLEALIPNQLQSAEAQSQIQNQNQIQNQIHISTLQCGHKFHRNCVNDWFFTGATTCPLCRSAVPNILERIEITA
jgi:uncharacterized protein YggT (Ycf19 family)